MYSCVFEAFLYLFEDILGQEIATPFARMPICRQWKKRHDQADTRFGMKIQLSIPCLAIANSRCFVTALNVGGIFAGIKAVGAEHIKDTNGFLTVFAKNYGAKVLLYEIFEDNYEPDCKIPY